MPARQLGPLQSRPESLTEMVLGAVKEAIVAKTLPPGARVSEAMLAAQLEVSKTPVREALLRLRHIGLVVVGNGGLHVVQPSRKMIRNAYELRVGLERTAALLAAARRSEADRQTLAELAEKSLDCAVAGNLPGFRDSDGSFHAMIARCSGNPPLTAAIDDVLLLTTVLRLRDVPGAGGSSVECAKEHVRITEAIGEGNAELAAQAMSGHIGHVLANVLAVAESAGDESGGLPALSAT